MWILKIVVKALVSLALFVLMFNFLVIGVGQLVAGNFLPGILCVLVFVGITALNRVILTDGRWRPRPWFD